jgi:biotin carboxylase
MFLNTTNKKKLLIAGGGYADIPTIIAAKALGYYVITSSSRAEDLGHNYSDECHLIDFSNKSAMLDLAESLQIDAICACCNDFSALTAAYVAEKMGIPGHDSYQTALIIHHKDLYRRFAIENNIPSPRAEGFESIETAIGSLHHFQFPIIVKPVDLTGGKGISRITCPEEAKQALELAFGLSRVKRVIVEEFIEGDRHGLSMFVRDGKIVFHFNDNEHYYRNPYLVSAASTPSDVSHELVNQLCGIAEKIVSLLSLKTGIFHMQYIISENQAFIIEICRRPPGDLYTRFVQYATGVDYPSYIVRAATGMSCEGMDQALPSGYFTRHCVMTSKNGEIKQLHFDPSIKSNIVGKCMWWKVGDKVEDFMTHKLGIVFMQFNSKEEMLEKTNRMQSLIWTEWA